MTNFESKQRWRGKNHGGEQNPRWRDEDLHRDRPEEDQRHQDHLDDRRPDEINNDLGERSAAG